MWTSHDTIETQKDLVKFIEELREEFQTPSDVWINRDLDSFLEAMAAWVNDMEGYYKNTGQAIPTRVHWGFIGHILRAATMYE